MPLNLLERGNRLIRKDSKWEIASSTSQTVTYLQSIGWMDDGWIGGCVGGSVDGRMDGRVCGWLDR